MSIITIPQPTRRRLPDTRHAVTHQFTIAGHNCHILVGLFEDGTPGELFVKMSKEGSTMRGLMDTIGVLTSIALQYGVPLSVMAGKLRDTKFEPQEHEKATSVVDYIYTWLEDNYPCSNGSAKESVPGSK